MNYNITIPLSVGFRLFQREKVLDASFAFAEILAKEKQFKYTRAEFFSDSCTVKLISHVCVCPACSQQMPAYPRFTSDKKVKRKLTRELCLELAEQTRSLFSENGVYNLYYPIDSSAEVTCVHCGAVSNYSDKIKEISLSVNSNVISVSYPIENIRDLISVSWADDPDCYDFPIKEICEFDFDKGETRLLLRSSTREIVASERVVNGECTKELYSPLLEAISQNTVLRRKLKKAFESFWDKSLPFKEDELVFESFSLMAQYIGYNKEFFFSVPRGAQLVEVSAHLGEKLGFFHKAENLISLYEASELPDIKSVKKLMYSVNPAFFFYIDVLERLWMCIGKDPNIFCSILKNKSVFLWLAFLEDCPGALCFIEDFCKNGFKKYLPQLLLDYPAALSEYAVLYNSFSPSKKERAQKLWKKDYHCVTMARGGATLYFNAQTETKQFANIMSQRLNGYTFSLLRTAEDYEKAAGQLKNCLAQRRFTNPIVGIIKGKRYVAALEIDTDTKEVVQAYLAQNKPIERDKGVKKALTRWCVKNKYEPAYIEFDEQFI